MDPRSRALLGQLEQQMLCDPELIGESLRSSAKAAVRTKGALDPFTTGRIEEGAVIAYAVQERIKQRLSDTEMAKEIGIHVRTFRKWVEADIEILAASCHEDPRPHKDPVRLWRPWEVQARWATRKRRGT